MQEGNVLGVYVCLFMGGPDFTIVNDALDLTVQGPMAPAPGHQMWHPLLVTSGGHH